MAQKHHRSAWILGLTSLGFFMAMMDAMIVTTASTAIRTEFHISVAMLQWALNAYNITIAAVLLVGVALGERWGRRRVYILGIFIFTLGSIGCALATNITVLIIARMIEGLGASVMTPMSMAILTNTLPAQERGRALGIWSGIGGLALIVGPSLGGLIVAKLTWQWIFWINVPIGLIAIYLSQQQLPESTGVAEKIQPLDAGLIMITLAGLIWALSALTKTVTATSILVGIVSVLLGGWFIWRQKRSVQPLMPVQYFNNRTFTGANLATFLLYAAMYGVVFFLPQFLQIVLGGTALTAGLGLLPWTGTLVVVAPFAGQAVDRFGSRTIAMWGLLLQGLGYLVIGLLVMTHHTYGWLVLPLMAAGIGLSMAGPALQKAVLGSVPVTALGKAAGIYNVFRLLGGAVGTVVAVLVFYRFGAGTTATAFTLGFRAAMISAASLSLLGIMCCWQVNE
ncbi:MFS transporter [Lactiplantibacillus daowaiensis]|uniref:MFS transporter n=1 Tax=Lactiplantibacillus daowaiensis TaxID=2559918 RepID=A0ABW1RZP9_9LACO|nr:MFS transporter [Lactiplantibacillus daowaiensis]